MERKKKKAAKNRQIIWYVLLAVLFVLIIGITVGVAIGKKIKSDEDYTAMAEASLPTIRVNYGGNYDTELFGYVNEMNLLGMRDVIVPLGADRNLSLNVYTYGNNVPSVSYYVRSLNGETYIDGGTVETESPDEEGVVPVNIRFSELLESGTEYSLILSLPVGEKTVRYYTRMLYAKTMYAEELLNFAETFSEATYDRNKSEFIVNYIQPDNDSETKDYSYTDIHSKYTMFTFGSLDVKRGENVRYRITEMEPTQLSVTLEYEIKMKDGERWRSFETREFFCVRIRSGKVYLLDYHRTLTEKFSPENSTREKGRILLGVGEEDGVSVINSENHVYTIFVKDRELWSYNAKTNAMNRVFSFVSENDKSNRSSYDHHDVEVVKVSDDGNIDFMVYGYMNRGAYEGEVGICFYRYDASVNATSPLFYMPVYQSEQILRMDLGTLAYVNAEDVCYLRYGDGIYSIDLNSGESVEVSIRAYPGMYAKNKKGNVVAWQEGTNLTYPERLVILNMDTQTTLIVNAETDRYIKILDFIGDDIIYGFGKTSDSMISANIDINQLLERVVIASTDEKLTVQEEYKPSGSFILGVDVFESRIAVKQVQKNRDGTLTEIPDEVLLVTQSIYEDADNSMVIGRNNEDFKKEYYIQVGRTTNSDSQFSLSTPRFEILKKANVIELLHKQENVYYVYGYGEVLAVESEINKAIREAYDVFGSVLDERMNTVWTRGTRDLFKTISIQPYLANREDETLVAALRVLCAQEGIQLRDCEEKLEAGESPLSIIDGAIGERRAINLYGCTLQEALYFVNEGHPVLAITGNREGLVIHGYDTDNVYFFNPYTGETEPMLLNDAAVYFEGINRFFITYK